MQSKHFRVEHRLHTLKEHKPCKATACASTQCEHGVVGTAQIIPYRVVQETVCGGDFHLFARKGRDAFIIIFHVIQTLRRSKIIVYKKVDLL